MSVKFRSVRRLALLVAVVALLVTPLSAFAQGGTPFKGSMFRSGLTPPAGALDAYAARQTTEVSPQDATIEVIAEGLNNPRGLDITGKNILHVAEAGLAGDDCVEIDPVGDPGFLVCTGDTGSVTRINLNTGAISRVATGFPSLGSGYSPEEIVIGTTGLTDVSLQGGNFGIIGLGANPALRELVGEAFGYEVKNPQSPKWRYTVDVSQHEADENPDGDEVDSNPYSVAAINGVQSVVADAGANALLHVNSAQQVVHTLAVFPNRIVPVDPMLQAMFGLPPELPAQAVPNAVVVGPDGAYYVGLLGGFPFTPGYTGVYRVAPDGSMALIEDGFTAIIDIAFDADGNLYVLELAKNGLIACEFFGDCTGALIKVDAVTGDRTEIASDGLFAPGGLAISSSGAIYVSNYSVFGDMGQVVMVTP
jgi:hypothetical protein